MLRWLRDKFRRRSAPAARATTSRPDSVPPVPKPAPAPKRDVTLDDINAVIPERNVRPPDPMAVSTLVDLVTTAAVGGTFQFPSFPATSLRIMNLLDKPTVDLNEVVRALHWEPAAVTEILKVASSVRIGRGQFEDLRSAVMALGTAEVGAIAVAVASRSLLQLDHRASYDLFPGLWRSAHHDMLAIAFTASWLAQACHVERSDRVFLRALLEQIGRVVALRVVSAEILAKRLHPAPLTSVIEAAVDDAQHDVLELALASWQLPPGVTALLDPGKATECAIVDLAAAIAVLQRAPYRYELAERVRDAMVALHLDASWLKVILREYAELSERARAMAH